MNIGKPQGSTMLEHDRVHNALKATAARRPWAWLLALCLLAWLAQADRLRAQDGGGESSNGSVELIPPGVLNGINNGINGGISNDAPVAAPFASDLPGTPPTITTTVTRDDFQRVLDRLEAAEKELKKLRESSPGDKIEGKPTVKPASSSTSSTNSSSQPIQEAPEVAPLGAPDNPAYGTSRQLDNVPDEFFETTVPNSGRPSWIMRGRFMGDTFNFSQDPASKSVNGDVPNGFAWRQARFGVQGDAYNSVFYQIEMDFGGGVAFKSTYLGFAEIPLFGNIMIGYFKQPFSLEEMPTEENIVFMERSTAGLAFVPGRQTGVKFLNSSADRRNTYSAGLFYTDTSDSFADNVSNNMAESVAARFTWLPYYDEPSGGRYYWHLGLSAMSGRPWQNQASFGARPETDGYPVNINGVATNQVPNFVNTHSFYAQGEDLLDLETAVVHNSLLFQSEIMMCRTTRFAEDGPANTFWGGYWQMSYFLTGEYRPYDRFQGFLTRVYPNERFFSADRRKPDRRLIFGKGAWEVSSRYSYIDLNSGNIQGGVMGCYTAGLSWIANPHTRFEWNYVHAVADAKGTPNETDIFMSRFIQSF